MSTEDGHKRLPFRRRVHLARALSSLLLLSTLLCAVLIYRGSPSPDTIQRVVQDAVRGARTGGRNCRLPSRRYHRLTQGRWLAKPYVVTDAKMTEEWGSSQWPCQRDWDPSWKSKPVDPQVQSEMLQSRLRRIASYDWYSDGADAPLPWNGTELILRALNSERGLIMIGDSLHKQAYDMLPMYLTVPRLSDEQLFHRDADKQGAYPQEFHSKTWLRDDTEYFQRVREALPDVPLQRLKRPFITFVRNELLLDWPEIDAMLKDIGKMDWDPEGGWWLYNASYTEYLPTERTSKWPGEQNSILFFNTGAHWSANRFKLEKQGVADRMYAKMVDRMISRLMRVPKLDLIYRSMTVGHFDCLRAGAPIYPTMPHELNQPSKEESWKSAFGWSSFPYYDRTWSTALDRAAPDGKTLTGGRVVYLNVTETVSTSVFVERPYPDVHSGAGRHWIRMFQEVLKNDPSQTWCA